MEIFTGHSPYHNSYNNPVMFRDPSGLAPEGEKNNTVQAGGSDIISSGYTGGFWAEKTISVYEGSFKSPLGLDNPLAPAKRIKYDMYGSETSYVWIGGSSGAGGGGGGMATPESGEGASSSQNSSKKTYNNTTSKSMRDQIRVESLNNKTEDKGQIKDVTHQFNNDILKTQKFFEKNRTRINGYMNWKLILSPFDTSKEALEFIASMVGTGKKFDLKQDGKGYSRNDLGGKYAVYEGEIWNFDDFGNYNYGVAARAFNIPIWLALAGAGYNQTFQSWTPDLTNIIGFFDHKRDKYMIIRGYYHED